MILKLLGFLWRNAPAYKYLIIFVAVVAGLSRNALLQVINGAASESDTPGYLSFWLPLFLITIVVFCTFTYIFRVYRQVVVMRIIEEVRLRLTRNLFKVQPSFIEKRSHGQLYQVMTQDVNVVSEFTARLLEILPAVIFLTIAVPQVFLLSPVAGGFAVFVMIGGVLGYYVQQRAIRKGNSDIRALQIRYFDRVADILDGFREIKLHNPRRDDIYGDVSSTVSRLRQLRIATERRYTIGDLVVQGLKFILFGGILFLVPFVGDVDARVVFQLLTVILFSLDPFEQIVSKYPSFIATTVSFQRVQELDEELQAEAEHTPPGAHPVLPFSKIALKDVVAHYDTKKDGEFTLGPINFELSRGEVIFIVGSNGSGKTTFLNVLAGLLTPASGTIEVDGTALKPEQLNAYRARFSAVFSRFHLFKKLYGLSHVSGDEIVTILDRFGLNSMTTVEDGSFTRLDLSSGQRRRLALAVIYFEDREIIILDEFVADQDPERRRFFFEALIPELKRRGKTVVVTTHDLQWVEKCDRLLHFKDGRIERVDDHSASLQAG